MPEATSEASVWERRLARERAARRQAERTAEQGMRELWLANQQLEGKVQERTDLLERVRFLDARIMNERLAAVRRCCGDRADAAALAFLQVSGGGEGAEAPWRSRELAEEILRRWQLATARRGLLLVASAGDDDRPVDGGAALGVLVGVDALIHAAVECGCTGSLPVDFAVGPAVLQARVQLPTRGRSLEDEPLFRLAVDLLAHLPGVQPSVLHGERFVEVGLDVALPGDDPDTGREQPVGA